MKFGFGMPILHRFPRVAQPWDRQRTPEDVLRIA